MLEQLSGASVLPLVEVDTHSEELRDERGFIGDRANRRAFDAVLQDWRDRVKLIVEEDPLGTKPGRQSKKKLDRAHKKGGALTAGIMHTAIEEFAAELATVTLRFLETEQWRGTERIVVGGGLSSSRVGEVIIGRASVLVKAEGKPVLMAPIRNHPDEAALIGATQLAPSWMLRGSDALLAVDIGGSNIRAGLVELRLDVEPDLSLSSVRKLGLWRYADEKVRPTREEAIDRIISMLTGLVELAKEEGLRLAPIIGVACPGAIAEDGTILRGGQNLPGNWEEPGWNLGAALSKGIPSIEGHETLVIIHNDAVVQGLSEAPFMRDIDRWGVLTIGTGLGNARFSNRPLPSGGAEQAA
ncbi:MAG: ROK family protein [Polyangiaceae bacterium]|nr:ROK family protein [Polyangiaceae bacterium]